MQRFLIIVLGLILFSGCDFTVGTPYNDKKDSKTIWDEPIGDSRFSGWFALEHVCGRTTLRFEGTRTIEMRYFSFRNPSFWYSTRYLNITENTLSLYSISSMNCDVYIEELAEFYNCPFEFIENNTILRIESPAGSGNYWNFVKRDAGPW